MPKLLMFAPCEKVLIDQQNNISLIALLQEVSVEVPEPPLGTMAALKWDAFSLWLKTPDDAGRSYEQRVALFDPSGHPTGIEGSAPLNFGDKLTLRNIATVFGFPISATGRYLLKLWLYEKGQPPKEHISEFPILVVRQSPKTPSGSSLFDQPPTPTSPS